MSGTGGHPTGAVLPTEVSLLAAAAGVQPPPVDENAAFRRLAWRQWRNRWRQALAQSRLRLALITSLSAVFWFSLFVLFFDGFRFLAASIPYRDTHTEVISGVFGLFFVSLLMMLVFSTGVILYGSLYRSAEVAMLLTLPASPGQIFALKFQEAVLFSSWGFLLMGTPMLVAYGLVALAPWYYYVLLVPMMVAFVLIPSALGAMACMLIVFRLPTAKVQVLWIALAVLLLWLAWLVWQAVGGPEGDWLTPTWFHDMLSRVRFSQTRLLPSWWLSAGLLEAARRPEPGLMPAGTRPPWAEGLLYFVLLMSNALLLRQLAIGLAGRVLRAGYSRLHAEVPSRRQVRVSRLDQAVMQYAFGLSPAMRLLIVKDLRLFRRDPVQWSQFLIFFGLLGLYAVNVQRFGYRDQNYRLWVHMISFLNLGVVSLILSTFTTRFIFPMISLEGRRFWILGLLPIRRDTILWGKLLFAALGSLLTCTPLVLLSDLMLEVSPLVVSLHFLACVLLCVGLSAIAVGLGARLPNLREESPSKIAAGFGGTLNLVCSTVYIVLVVGSLAVASYLYQAGQISALWLGLGAVFSLICGSFATAVPLVIGFRAFRRLEF